MKGMKMIDFINYKDWKIYFLKSNNEYKKFGRKIVDKNYKVLDILKNTERNYVAVIVLNDKKYVLKEFRSEIVIPQRRLQTFLKKGEALTTLQNSAEAMKEGIVELVKPLIAIVNKKICIQKSYLLMEYIEGEKLKSVQDIYDVIKITKKIHNLNRYHGDLNTSNFIKTEIGMRVFDTQMKKEKLWFKRSRDLLLLKEDLLVLELNIDVEKLYDTLPMKFEYKLGKICRKLKKIKMIQIIRDYKKKLRKKGWKI